MNDDRRLIRLSEVRPRSQGWLWPGRIPLGALTVLEGDPAQAKSTLTYDITARVTKGRAMPHSGGVAAPAGVVLLHGRTEINVWVRDDLAADPAAAERRLIEDNLHRRRAPHYHWGLGGRSAAAHPSASQGATPGLGAPWASAGVARRRAQDNVLLLPLTQG